MYYQTHYEHLVHQCLKPLRNLQITKNHFMYLDIIENRNQYQKRFDFKCNQCVDEAQKNLKLSSQ